MQILKMTAVKADAGIRSPAIINAAIPAQKATIHQSVFDTLPDSGYAREAQLVQGKNNPSAPLPFSSATLWRLVAAKDFPAPVKLGSRVTAWKIGSVRAWMAQQEAQPYAPVAIKKTPAKRTALVMA